MTLTERFIYLQQRYLSRQETEAERTELFTLLIKYPDREDWETALQTLGEQEPANARYEPQRWEILINSIVNQPAPKIAPVHVLKTAWFRWAAAIILLFGTGAYLWIQQKEKPGIAVIHPTPLTNEVLPGKEGAILTLADGTQMVLDSMRKGVIATQNGTQAVLKNGQLTYDLTGNVTKEIVYNTMTTPKGRQFQVILPDGTKVWLNAASSIRYPTVFAGSERRVEIIGEAYFEVAKNTKMPFKVNVNNKAEVEVLGTHFNVNAYENEAGINTTLLEGSVRIAVAVSSDRQQQVVGQNGKLVGQKTQPGNGVVLKPGQQAQLAVDVYSDRQPSLPPSIKVVSNADIDKVIAWKNGLFNFEGATLQEVMKQLERWYDIKVVFEKGVPNIAFGGKLTKNISLNDLLTVLEKSEVHFRLEKGRRLIVTP